MMCFYRSVRFVPDNELQELSSWNSLWPQSKAAWHGMNRADFIAL